MGPYRAASLALGLVCALPALGQVPGWHYSYLPGEGDRASLGCARDATPDHFTCLAVRCEDDYSVGIHVHTSRHGGGAGRWEMTVDREDHIAEAVATEGPYGARLEDPEGWLLERLRQGTFVYLHHAADPQGAFAYIDLGGSLTAITEALQWCAPRVVEPEQNPTSDVEGGTQDGDTP